MDKVKYSLAVQTCMEIFDFLMNFDIFVYDSGENFLFSKVIITEQGLRELTQNRRGVWDENYPKINNIPTIKVLKILTDFIDDLILTDEVPSYPEDEYAYLHEVTEELSGETKYYSSYRELADAIRRYKESYIMYNDTNGKIIDFSFFRNMDLNKKISKMSDLDKKLIMCYAELEEEIINATKHLLLKNDNEAEKTKYSSWKTEVDWETFKDAINSKYIYLAKTGQLDTYEASIKSSTDNIQIEQSLDGRKR